MLTILLLGCHSPPVQSSDAQPPADLPEAAEAGDRNETTAAPALLRPGENLPVSHFREIWAYLVAGREHALTPNLPVSDLCYFSADIDSYGKLSDIPDFRNVASFPGRKHLVTTCGGRALTHFVLAEGSPERRTLIRDLLEASKPYDGLQIDFEYVLPRDGNIFLSFIRELRAALGSKILTIALPARTRTLQDDVFDYGKIEPYVDRILVMAYDEHWSSSEPGPIASMGWCRRVARYSLETIGPEKLIMGLPFYGRSWGNVEPNRAHVYSGIEDIVRAENIGEIRRENGIPTFSYQTPLSVTVYYEDDHSLSTRLDMYRNQGVGAVGFWRLGQETPAFWPLIALQEE